ncbi:hypothetical protein AB6A40_004329 [Gnathostoma spinigerum]|uniref:BTB/POZ domain-containing protein n=1 Tax=Gnathostoma spinigerum TaxID=75299 RepID=A0ABD6EDA1_9BILA
MNKRWTVERRWKDVDISGGVWEASTSEYGFKCSIKCLSRKGMLESSLMVSQEENCVYSLLVDVLFSINDIQHEVEQSLWDSDAEVFTLVDEFDKKCLASVQFSFRVVEMLSPQNLTISTPYRTLKIKCEDLSFFVDPGYLASLGGMLFDRWKQLASKGETHVEITDMSRDELICLLDAICKYRQIIVHRKNYCDLLAIAAKYAISSVLRAVESFLIDVKWIHPIRKLEYAVVYRLARLGDAVVRSIVTSAQASDVLYDYLNLTGEPLEQMHPDVLTSLNIFPDHVIIY